MPLLHVSMRAGKSASYRAAVMDGLYHAMRECFDVPEDDQFIALTEHETTNFRYGASYLGISRSDDVVFVQITANDTRTQAQKNALFSKAVELLAESPGIRPEDVLINIVEVSKGNWSLGNGVAQYA